MIRYFAAHPTAANLIVIAFMALGVVAMAGVKRETFPDVPPTNIQITVPYPGATAEDAENALCRRIEDAIEGVANREETRCEAREGFATATAEMSEGNDFDRFLNDIKTEVEAIDNFPDQVETPTIKQLGMFDFVAWVAVTGPMAPPDLKAYVEDLKDRMLLAGGISKITIHGFSQHQIRVEVGLDTLRQFGLAVSDIADAVGRQSIDLPSGTLETGDSHVLVRFADERGNPREFEDLIVISGRTGAEIRLGDIATITDRFELDEAKSIFNGSRAAYLVIEKTKVDDTLSVIDAVNAFLDDERHRAPPEMRFVVTGDISSIVRDRLNMLLKNGAQGLGLVFLTMWLFFSFRFSFWVSAALPVSFLGTIFGMSVLGYSFDMITMVGLLIAIGLLVDDSIVIAENIATQVARGKPFLDAAVDGINQVKLGVIASFLTTICIFGSLAFLKGHIGIVLKVMPVILILTLAISLIEAFLVLPHHLGHALKDAHKKKPRVLRLWLEGAIEFLREKVLGAVVDWAISRRYLAVGLVGALFLVSVAMPVGGILKFKVFPDLDGDHMEARILLPQGTPLARTEEVVAHLVAAVEQVNAEFTPNQPDGRPLVENIGVRFDTNVDAHESGPHVATVNVDLLGAEIRDTRLDDAINRWRELSGPIPDVIAIKFTEPQLGPAGRAIDIRLMGPDLDRLKAASLDLQGWLDGYAGVKDLSDDLRPGKPEVRLSLREGATALGLSAEGIARQLRAAYHGTTASEIQVGAESLEIDVRLSAADQDSLADLEYFYVNTPDGKQVPLSAAAAMESGRGFARIARVDGRRTVTIQGDLDSTVANAAEVIAHTRAHFLPELEKRYPDVTTSLEGQEKEGAKTSASLQRGFSIGLLGVFILLSFLFRSYIEPFIVMVAIPLSLIGVIWGHLAMGLPLSMPSMMGFASLAGVIVNNSILLVEFIKIGRRQGLSPIDAARAASRLRFRSILLTSMTTIMGLLPLLMETSLQAQVLVPLVTSLAFGLFAGTALLLIVVPALYAILDDFGLTAKVEEGEAV